MRHFVSVADLTREDVLHLFEVAAELKTRRKAGDLATPLAGRSIALIFEKPSLRTRVTFEVGAVQLGGRAVYLMASEIGLGTREAVSDVARNLSLWVDGIVARVNSHETVLTLARRFPSSTRCRTASTPARRWPTTSRSGSAVSTSPGSTRPGSATATTSATRSC